MPRLPSNLNQRQQAFIVAYLIHFNATRAAIEAGYSAKTAGVQGFGLLRNPKIAAALEKAQAKSSAKHENLADRTVAEVEKLAFMDETSEEGKWSFARATAKQKALDWLAKHLGLWKQPETPTPVNSTTINVLVSDEDATRIIASLVEPTEIKLLNGNGNGNGNGDANH